MTIKNGTKYLEALEDLIKASLEFKTPEFDGMVKYGATHFQYATYGELVKCVKSSLLKYGIIFLHTFAYENNQLFLITTLRHKNGSIVGMSEFPLSITNKKMQEIGSQITYLKRYSLSSLLCLCAEDDDDCVDIKDTKFNETINDQQIKNIRLLLDGDTFAWKDLKIKFGYEKVSDIHQAKYDSVVNWLNIFNQNKGISNGKAN